MSKISKILKLEHDFEHDFKVKKKYSVPKIYDANGNLSKRWYIYFSYRNPENGKLERQDNVYSDLDKYKTLRGRTKAAKLLREVTEEILANGFNPFVETNSEKLLTPKKLSVPEAIKFVLNLKESTLAASSFRDFKSRINNFRDWLLKNGFEYRFMTSVTKEVVVQFLNEVMLKSSAANRNNTRSNLSLFYTALVNNNIVERNFIKDIHIESATPVRNKTYTITQENDLYEYLVENYPVFFLFIKFVSYNFLRPIEVCRLKVGDIDVINKQLQIKTKTKAVKIKIIPEILFNEIPDLSKFSNSDSLFNMNTIGGVWETEDDNKRNYYSQQFLEVKKIFGLNENYGLYSFRHTFITKLYREFRKEMTVFEAESKLMMITGHATHQALKKYLRDIDAELPDDYSKHIKKANAKKK